jgi:hypothetical protein
MHAGVTAVSRRCADRRCVLCCAVLLSCSCLMGRRVVRSTQSAGSCSHPCCDRHNDSAGVADLQAADKDCAVGSGQQLQAAGEDCAWLTGQQLQAAGEMTVCAWVVGTAALDSSCRQRL